MGSATGAPSALTSSGLDPHIHALGHIFQFLICQKGLELGERLLLTTNYMASFMGSPAAPWHMVLGDLNRSSARSLKMEICNIA